MNSGAYDAALRQRGSLAVWFTDAADPGVEGRTTDNARRPAALFGPGYCDGADAQNGVPLGPSADRRPDRLHHRPARSRCRGAGPHHLEPPGRELGCRSPSFRLQSRAPAGRQYRPEALRLRRMARSLHSLPTIRTIRTASMARSPHVIPRRVLLSHHAPAPCRATKPRQHPRCMTCTYRPFPSVAAWHGRKPQAITGVPWLRPTPTASNGLSVTSYDRAPIGVERPRSPLP